MNTPPFSSLLRITAPHFVAGAVVEAGTVVKAAPILTYMTGWPLAKALDYCVRKRWGWQVIED